MDVKSLQANVPSLHIGQTGNQQIVTLRAIGLENLTSTGEAGVQFYVDGVPLGRPSAAGGLFFDLQNLQVLRGPQGTQGGRAATGGRIWLESQAPSPDLSVEGDYQYGSYDQHLFRSVINLPLFDEELLMFRFSSVVEKRDGYQKAIFTDVVNSGPPTFTTANDFSRKQAAIKTFCKNACAQNLAALVLQVPNSSPAAFAVLPFRDPNSFPRNTASDAFGDSDQYSLRAQLRSVPFEGLDLRLIGTFSRQEGNGPAVSVLNSPALPGNVPFDPAIVTDNNFTTTADVEGLQNNRAWGITAKMNYAPPTLGDLGDWEVNWTGSYQNTFTNLTLDFDGTNANNTFLLTASSAQQLSSELTFETVENSVFNGLFGFFYYYESIDQGQFIDPFGPNAVSAILVQNDVRSESRGIYGEFTWKITDSIEAFVGMRYSWDTKRVKNIAFTFPGQGQQIDCRLEADSGRRILDPSGNQIRVPCEWSAFTPRFAVNWNITDDSLFTFNISRGYKPGGLEISTFGRNAGSGDRYKAERVWSYEITSKNDFFDRRMRINLTAFWNQFDPFQICQINGTSFQCKDSGEATTRGVELEYTLRPIPELEISGNAHYLDTRVDDFVLRDPTEPNFVLNSLNQQILNPNLRGQDLSGNALPKAPKWAVKVGIQYDITASTLGFGNWGTITPRMDFEWNSQTFYRVFNKDEFSTPAFGRLDISLNWRSTDDRWKVETFVRNVTDVDVINSIFVGPNTGGSPLLAQFLAPRTAGVRVGFTY